MNVDILLQIFDADMEFQWNVLWKLIIYHFFSILDNI
jgi:hypothetical protein